MSGCPDRSSLSTYGGAKVNYADIEDPNTDREAAQANQAYADTAAMTRTALRIWLRFTGNATTPVLVDWDSMWGNAGGYNPTFVRNGLGDVTVILPASVLDELVVSHSINLATMCGGDSEGSTCFHVKAQRASANTLRVFIFTAAGAASDAVGTTLKVWSL